MTNQIPLLPNNAPRPKPTPCNCESKASVKHSGDVKESLTRCDVFGGCALWYLNDVKLVNVEQCQECKKLGMLGWWIFRNDDLLPSEHLGLSKLGCQYVPF